MIVAISIVKEQIPLIEAMCGTVITASYIYDCTVVFYTQSCIEMYGNTWHIVLPKDKVYALHVSSN